MCDQSPGWWVKLFVGVLCVWSSRETPPTLPATYAAHCGKVQLKWESNKSVRSFRSPDHLYSWIQVVPSLNTGLCARLFCIWIGRGWVGFGVQMDKQFYMGRSGRPWFCSSMVGQTYAVMLGPYHTQPGCEVVPTSGFGSRAELWETQRKAFAIASNSIAFNFLSHILADVLFGPSSAFVWAFLFTSRRWSW